MTYQSEKEQWIEGLNDLNWQERVKREHEARIIRAGIEAVVLIAFFGGIIYGLWRFF